MRLFKEIKKDKVFRLEMPSSRLGASVTLVILGNQIFLINCGSCDAAVVDHIVPALKKKRIPLSKINYLMFTDCHPENIGGARKLKQLAPGIRIVVTSYQADKLKNPMFYMLKRWSEFSDWAPPLRELRGIVASNENIENDKEFEGIVPIAAPGHDDTCVCWHIKNEGVLVCDGALQGNGREENGKKSTGTACYNDLDAYGDTLDMLSRLCNDKKEGIDASKILLCNSNIGVKSVAVGEKEINDVINACRSEINKNKAFLQQYMRAHGVNYEMINYHSLVTEYFPKGSRPEILGYAMMTFKAHCSSKQNSESEDV